MLPLPNKFISAIDTTLKTLFPPTHRTGEREYPAQNFSEKLLTKTQRNHVAGLMRVNHSGEVCAQALYLGQALSANLKEVRQKMEKAAAEETEHLGWCEQRLNELEAKPSMLNPLWYSASFLLGVVAGYAGDKYSLGFVEETENQVSKHLENHLKKLPAQDKRSQAILEQMLEDEMHHANEAHNAGAVTLPLIVRFLMGRASKIMTKSSYYL